MSDKDVKSADVSTDLPSEVMDNTDSKPDSDDMKQESDLSKPASDENKPDSDQNVKTKLKREFSVPVMSIEEKRNFYRKIFSPYGELSQDLKEKAKDELNEVEDKRGFKVNEIREVISVCSETESGEKVREHFADKDDAYLVKFLRTKKFDVQKTYDMMTAYVKFRIKYDTINDRLTYDGVCKALGNAFPGILPYKDREGRVVLLFDTGSWNPDEVSFDEMMASFLFLLENLVENEENQIRGFVLLETYEKYHISQALRMKASDIKKLTDMLQGSFPGRFKGFHVIRQPWYFSIVMALAKPFMGSKLASRIFVHGFNLKGLYDWIPPEHLPESYGGLGEEYDPQPLLDELKSCLLEREAMRT